MNPGEGGEFCSFQRKSRKLTPAGEIDGIALVVLGGTAQKTHSFKAKLSSEGLGTHGFGSCRNEQPRDVGRSAFQTVLHNTQR